MSPSDNHFCAAVGHNELCINFLHLVLDLFLQIWNLKPGWGSRPDIHVEKSHSDDITGLKFSSDGRHLLSRSFDGSLKVIMDVFRPNYCPLSIELLPYSVYLSSLYSPCNF